MDGIRGLVVVPFMKRFLKKKSTGGMPVDFFGGGAVLRLAVLDAYGWAGIYSSEPWARTVEGSSSRPLSSSRRRVEVLCFAANWP